jgi:arylsulfatase A-like enzyme
MWKWLLGLVAVLVLALGILAANAQKIVLHYPVVLSWIASVVDPIGPPQEVTWAPGPETAAVSPGDRVPNIVVILVDDMGWNDLTWNGGGIADGTVPTPNIDSLARDGAEFRMGYAGNATCAPSRAALLTGRYPPRFGFESTPAPAAMGKMIVTMNNADRPDGQPKSLFFEDRMSEVPDMFAQGVPPSEITLAEVLREEGYRTLMFGKWHLGSHEGQRPTDQGFDESLGFYSGASLFGAEDDPNIVNSKQEFDPIDVFIWKVLHFAIRKNNEPRFTPPEYMTDYLSAEAAKAIETNRNRPFFLYLAYNAPHNPLQATRADYEALSHIEDHATRVYGAMVRSLDRGVGEVLDALRRNGLEENTLVVFSSDNGGAGYLGIPDLNKPYRGWKMTFFEGGLHSPFFMKWPAVLPKGVVVDSPISHIDVFSTAAAAAGAELPGDRVIDGVDLIPYATGQKAGEPHDALFWRSGGLHVVMADGWKLQVDGRQKKRWLFNLNEDPTEQRNRIAEKPERARELQARLDAFNEEMGPRHFPVLVEGAVPIDRTSADPYVPGEEFAYWPN